MKNRVTLFPLVLLPLFLFFLLAGCAGRPAEPPLPTQPPRDRALENSFEEQLRSMDPSAVSIFHDATTAGDTGDNQKSQLLLERVIQLAPDFSTAYRRLGYIEAYVNGNTDRALQLLRKAMTLEANGYNRAELATILLLKDTPAAEQEAFTLASLAALELPDDYFANTALVLASAAVDKLDITRQTNEHLIEVAPWNPIGYYYSGLLAAMDKHWEKAEADLRYAKRLGMDAEVIQDALDTGISRNVAIIQFLRWSAIALAGWLGGLGILFLAGSFLSKATIRSLNKMEPTIGAQLQPSERLIRSIYRFMIVVLSLYYYISIPFVILALIFVVGGAFYIFFLIGRIPIQLAILLVIMLLASLFAIVRSVLTKNKVNPVGRPVSRTDAPQLWDLVETVARKMETRPVDSIFLTPYAGISVNEKGGMLKTGPGQRNLQLGMGVLAGLNQGQFASILAHEYGHFSNRDTAGGDLAFQVYANLNRLAAGLVQSRSHLIYNPVWLFVMVYQRIFLRVSLGASRLQEVLADRFAAIAYGRENFIEGLKNIVKKTLAFQLHASFEVNKMLQTAQPLNNIYQMPMQEDLQGELEQRFDAAMKQRTSQYDSHPCTQERIALVERMRVPYGLDQENTAPVSALFPDFEELQQDLTAKLIQNLPR